MKFVDLKIGITIKEEIDETTGTKKHRVSETFLDTLQPRVIIINEKDFRNTETFNYLIWFEFLSG